MVLKTAKGLWHIRDRNHRSIIVQLKVNAVLVEVPKVLVAATPE